MNRTKIQAASYVLAGFMLVSALGACGGGQSGTTPTAIAQPPGDATDSVSASLPLTATDVSQSLPALGSITSTVSIPQNNAPKGAMLSVTVSTSSNAISSIPAVSPQAFVYLSLTSSVDVAMRKTLTFSVTLPSAPKSQGQFYAWSRNAAGVWSDMGTVIVSGTTLTFGGRASGFSLLKDSQIVIVPFTAKPLASCPTPPPTPTPGPTASPSSSPTVNPSSSPTPCPESTNGVPLGTDSAFAILAYSTVTNTGPTLVKGNLGVSPGTAVVGFGPGSGTVENGAIDAGDAAAAQAQSDLTNAYNNAAGRPNPVPILADIGGTTIFPGVYSAPVSLQITGNVTLDGQGDPNSVFIFQIPSTLVTSVDSKVILTNGANPCNVFWQVGSSATLNTGSLFEGTILAQASISLGNGVTVNGRLLARTGAVTLLSDTVLDPHL